MSCPTTNLHLQKNKYYVVCTIPADLRSAFKGRKQIKRSTGTSCEKLARSLQHGLTIEIYTTLDQAATNASPVYIALAAYLVATGKTQAEADLLLKGVDLASPTALEDLLFSMRKDHVDGPAFEGAVEVYQAIRVIEPVEVIFPDASTALVFSELSAQYIAAENWNRTATKTKTTRYHNDFSAFIGDLPIDQITKAMVYGYAAELGQTLANKTIRNRITATAQAFNFGEKMGMLVKDNPFSNIKLTGYGVEGVTFKPFTEEQLTAIFAQKDMPEQTRLLLSILITTGMRLDEAALLTHEQIKTSKGIKHFDLTDALVKNKGSKRLVPVVPALEALLPATGSGRVFDFPVDADGKASSKISNKIMPWIRNITEDKMQVTHSLRGTLKDLLRDAGVTKEINDFITGHAAGDAAGRYGAGPSLQVRYDALNSVDHPWL